jgi:predicted dehydrogenase
VPDHLYGDVNRAEMWQIFKKQSIGPRAFIDAVINNSTVEPNFFDGYQVQCVIEAILESFKTARAVTVDY